MADEITAARSVVQAAADVLELKLCSIDGPSGIDPRKRWEQVSDTERALFRAKGVGLAAVAAPAVLRWYADEHHHFGGGSGPRWAGSEPLEPDAWCACGASWCEDGCTERETLLAIAAEIERASGSPEGDTRG